MANEAAVCFKKKKKKKLTKKKDHSFHEYGKLDLSGAKTHRGKPPHVLSIPEIKVFPFGVKVGRWRNSGSRRLCQGKFPPFIDVALSLTLMIARREFLRATRYRRKLESYNGHREKPRAVTGTKERNARTRWACRGTPRKRASTVENARHHGLTLSCRARARARALERARVHGHLVSHR